MICKPFDQGGLPLRALSMINKASNLKLCWDLANSVKDQTILLKAIVLRGGFHIHHHVPSSIWSSIKGEWEKVSSNSIVIIGNCTNTNFQLDSWCGLPLIDYILDPSDVKSTITIVDFLHNGVLSFPVEILSQVPNMQLLANQDMLPLESIEDFKA